VPHITSFSSPAPCLYSLD